MFKCFSKRGFAEEGESAIEGEFVSQVSLRGCQVKVDEEDGLKQRNRIITSSALIGVEGTDKWIDEGAINRTKEQFEWVIRWNQGSYFVINKTELPCSFHSLTCALSYNILQPIAVEERSSISAGALIISLGQDIEEPKL